MKIPRLVMRHSRRPADWVWELAAYNGEVARGLIHAPEFKERMVRLQAEFDREKKED